MASVSCRRYRDRDLVRCSTHFDDFSPTRTDHSATALLAAVVDTCILWGMAPVTTDVAQLRGACVGTISGVVAVAGHALGGGSIPSDSTAVLLILLCASVGAVAASVQFRRLPTLGLGLMLGSGQALGHITLTITAEHQHGSQPSLPMLMVHTAAIGFCALLIRAAEHSYAVAASTVATIVAVLLRPWAPQPPPTAVPARPRAALVQQQLLTGGIGTRGPPAGVLLPA